MFRVMSALTVPEVLLLARWRSIDFSTWNETEVREGFIIELLHTLGYRKGTTYDLEMEKPLKLTAPYHRIGRKSVSIDYAPSVRKRHFWIVEAKPGKSKEMNVGDLLQVHLYAVHPEVQARLVVLVNGWEIRVYDALTMAAFDDALLVVKQSDDGQTLAQLREMIGANEMLAFQRKRMLDLVQDTLSSEVDVAVADAVVGELTAIARETRKVVAKNADELRRFAMAEFFQTEKTSLEKMSLGELFVWMDLPEHGRRVLAKEFVRRVLAEAPGGQRDLVEMLVQRCHQRPHAIFRVLALRCLIDLIEAGVTVPASPWVKSLPAAVTDLAIGNIDYWSSNGLTNALCHLDNVTARVAMKTCLRLGQPFLQSTLEAWRSGMTAKERVRQGPSLDMLVASTCAHVQELLWRWYVSESSATAVWEGIWNLQAIELELDKLPSSAPEQSELDLYSLTTLGVSHDHLRNGTWNVTKGSVSTLQTAGVDDRVIAFAEQSHEAVRLALPQEKRPLDGWTPAKTLDDVSTTLTASLALRVIATVGRQLHSGIGSPG